MQLPGAEFGAFRWGYTVDPPLPGLTAKPLITRDLLPLGSPGAMDLLYALDDRAQANILDPASIAPVARLFGADTIWVSNDMAFDRFRTPRPELTNAAVRAPPPGLAAPQPFGTPTPNVPTLAMLDETALANPTIGEPVPPVELFDVDEPVAMVRAASRLVVLAGSGDGIVDAAGSRAAARRRGGPVRRRSRAPTIARRRRPGDRHRLEPRSGPPMARHPRRRRVHRDRRAAERPACSATRPINDFRCSPITRQCTRPPPRVEGLDIRASGYGEPFAYRPEDRPAMAVDGDPATAWVVGRQVRSDRSEHSRSSGDMSNLSLLQSQQPGASRMISSVRLDFDGARDRKTSISTTDLVDGSAGQRIEVPAGATFVRITITRSPTRPGATDPGPSAVGFAELGLGAHTEVVTRAERRDRRSSATDSPGDRAHPAAHRSAQPVAQRSRSRGWCATFTLGSDRDLAAHVHTASRRPSIRRRPQPVGRRRPRRPRTGD